MKTNTNSFTMGLNISIPNSKSKSRDPRTISVSATTITLGLEVLDELKVNVGDYVMIASLGKDLYFAKRPAGFPCYKIGQWKKSYRGCIYATDIQKNFRGIWELADKVDQTMTHDGQTTNVSWRKAVKAATADEN